MKIKYLAHASFLITSDSGIRIITDPYLTGVKAGLTYGPVAESADIVTISHNHGDHNNVSAVKGNPRVVSHFERVKGIEFNTLATFHDDAKGKMRGENTAFCFEVDGIRICHLGDLGDKLTDEQAADLGRVDILLVPVGGFYTINAKGATKICDKIKPKVVIPMHYKTDKCDYKIARVDEFIHGKKNVSRLDSSEAEFKSSELPGEMRIVVLTPSR